MGSCSGGQISSITSEGTVTRNRAAPAPARAQSSERPALTPSAATAQYYLAVLYDYVFGDGAAALPHYTAFAGRPAADARLVTRARERIRVLSTPN